MVPPKQLKQHLKNTHSTYYQKYLQASNHTVLQSLEHDFKALFTRLSSEPHSDALGGLPIYKAKQCPSCLAVFREKRAAENHNRQKHQVQVRFNWNDWTVCHAQQLAKGGAHTSLFRVNVPDLMELSQTLTANHGHTLVKDTREKITQIYSQIAAEQENTRLISPLLLATQWHIHTFGYNSKSICATWHPDQDYEYVALVVGKYVQQCLSLIPKTDNATLKYLNSGDPNKE